MCPAASLPDSEPSLGNPRPSLGSHCFSHSYLSSQAALSETRDAVPFHKAGWNESTNTFPSARLLLLFPDAHSHASPASSLTFNPDIGALEHWRDQARARGRQTSENLPVCAGRGGDVGTPPRRDDCRCVKYLIIWGGGAREEGSAESGPRGITALTLPSRTVSAATS